MAKAMSETTIHKDNYAAWCHANDKTLINGSKIYTGSITAEKISVTSLEAICAKIGGFSIGASALYNNTTSIAGANNSVYLGTDGISCGKDFKVTKEGEIYASKGKIAGFTIVGRGLSAYHENTTHASVELYDNEHAARMYSNFFEVIQYDGDFEEYGATLYPEGLAFAKNNQSASSYYQDGAIIKGELYVDGTAEFAGDIKGVNHSGNGSGQIVIGNLCIEFGVVSITSGTSVSQNSYLGSASVTFKSKFVKDPGIIANWAGQYANMLSVGASGISTTGATIWGRMTTASATRTIQWVAIGAIA